MSFDRQLLEQVLAGLDEGVTIQDREFRIVYQNDALRAALGHLCDGSFGRLCHEVYERRGEVCEGCGVAKAFATGGKHVVLREVDGPDGRRITWEATCFPLRDADGRIVAGVEVCRNVSEARRHAESLLRLSRRLESVTNPAEAIAAAGDEVRDTIGYADLWVYTFDEDRRHARLLGAHGAHTSIMAERPGISRLRITGDRLMEEITGAREIVVVEDARTDPRTDKNMVALAGNRTIIGVPVMRFDQHFGSMGTGTFGDDGVRPPTGAERTYLMALAGHLATTLDRLRLEAEQRQAAVFLRQLNRRLQTLSTCHQILIRATDERALLDDICRVICDEAGYRLAWVGYVHHDPERSISNAAWAGGGGESFADTRLHWSADDARGCGPAGEAVRGGRPVLVPDVAADERITDWHEAARTRGYRSALFLPLKDATGLVLGLLVVCAGETDSFTADETALLEDLAGDLAFGLVTLRDRAAREEARRQVQLLGTALNSVHEAAFILGADGRFQYVNDEACRSLEYAREELIGMRVLDIDAGPPLGDHVDTLTELKRRRAKTFTSFHRSKGGRVFPVEIHCSYLVFEGVELNLALARDISRRQQLEEDLRQAQKLESIGLLAGGVAHDFNNMLAVIMGSAEMALGLTGQADPAHELLETIVKATHSSADLTRQLLTFARRQVVAPKVFDLTGATTAMLRTLQRLAGEDVHLDWRPADGRLSIRLDPVQLDQMLVNLCANARDAVASGGRISIATRQEEVGLATPGRRPQCEPGPYAVLEVADDGRGMDAETRAHLFEPFFTTKELGHGLGLPTVYGIAVQNGGFVQVDSEPGRGTTFRVFLPLVPAGAPDADTPPRPATPARGTETILLAEDEPDLRELTGLLLESCGYRVLRAATAVEALSHVEAHRDGIDLLVTDIVMPGLNGCELAETVARRVPGLRCLYMSGYPADIIERHGLVAGDVRLLVKPFSLEQLASAVREVLDGRGAPTPPGVRTGGTGT